MAAVWTSVDGLSWQREPDVDNELGGEGTGQLMRSVTAGGPGLVAVGVEFDGAMVWTSSNGHDWQRVPEHGEVFALAGMVEVIAAGPGLVAVGHSWRDAPASTAPDGYDWQLGTGAVWTSPEGP